LGRPLAFTGGHEVITQPVPPLGGRAIERRFQMSRSTRSIRSNRFAETFDRPTRGPMWLAVVVSVVAGTLVACNVKDEKKPTNLAVVTQPDDSVQQQPTTDSVAQQASELKNVTFESAESAYQQKEYKQATEMFDAYIQRRPENPWGHYMLGLSAWKSGQLDVAVSAFERSIELDSSHVKSYLNLGRVLLEQKRASEALERITVAAQLDPTNAEVHRMLGRVHTTLRQPDSAIAAYRVALSIDATDVWSMNNMALVLIQQERYDEALPALARAVELRPGSPVFQNNLGIALENTGHFAAATEAYRAAIAADGTYVKATRSLARVTGIIDDPASSPVDLGMLAQAFDREVATWRAERSVPVGTTAVKPDSLTVPER
jgi:tetratricopeptide (TPR) repeat protein